MRPNWMIVGLVSLGSVGLLFRALGQDRTAPWPPPPVRVSPAVVADESPRVKAAAYEVKPQAARGSSIRQVRADAPAEGAGEKPLPPPAFPATPPASAPHLPSPEPRPSPPAGAIPALDSLPPSLAPAPPVDPALSLPLPPTPATAPTPVPAPRPSVPADSILQVPSSDPRDLFQLPPVPQTPVAPATQAMPAPAPTPAPVSALPAAQPAPTATAPAPTAPTPAVPKAERLPAFKLVDPRPTAPQLAPAPPVPPAQLHVPPRSELTPTSLDPNKQGGLTRANLNKQVPRPASLMVRAPRRMTLGKSAAVEITFANVSDLPLPDVVLEGTMSEGLYHPKGKQIALAPMSLPPGASKSIKLTLNAVRPGPQTLEMSLRSQVFGAEVAAITIEVEKGTLTLGTPSLRLTPGQPGDLQIEVSNQSGNHLKPVSVSALLPEGVEFLGANLRGIHQPQTRTVHWILDQLSPGETQTLAMRVQTSRTGTLPLDLGAQSEPTGVVHAQGSVAVEGFTDLKVHIVELDNPLEVGRDTAYEIHVKNQGSSPATGVAVKAQFSEGLVPKAGPNASKFQLDGRTAVFEAIPRLMPGNQAVLRIHAQGQRLGDQRLRALVACDQVGTPILREQQTLVVPR